MNNLHGDRPDIPEDPLPQLRADFPQFQIWREQIPGRPRYVARSLHDGIGPHTLITSDLAELRQELAAGRRLEERP